ncbi:unnamed protein product [Mytilus coruscus]|uniref:Uncharacterized protein n=1 Tax=Mytilus coruscus TaxID=42192 RepID=A0A6J8ASB7_MYTCO|nr:unnamed protein product [Mytilus coruscus]
MEPGKTSSNIRALPIQAPVVHCLLKLCQLALLLHFFLYRILQQEAPLSLVQNVVPLLITLDKIQIYTSAKEYKAAPLPFSGPLPCNTFKPKHLSTTQQGNSTQSFNESLQGVNLNELFNDFNETSVNINRTTLCPQVFNNCSVTIVYKKEYLIFRRTDLIVLEHIFIYSLV